MKSLASLLVGENLFTAAPHYGRFGYLRKVDVSRKFPRTMIASSGQPTHGLKGKSNLKVREGCGKLISTGDEESIEHWLVAATDGWGPRIKR